MLYLQCQKKDFDYNKIDSIVLYIAFLDVRLLVLGNDIVTISAFMFLFLFFPLMFEQKFFKDLEERKREFGIIDIQIGLTSLNDVFLNIAKKAELESATAEGRLTTLTLTSGTSFQVHNLFYVTILF